MGGNKIGRLMVMVSVIALADQSPLQHCAQRMYISDHGMYDCQCVCVRERD